MNVNPDDYDPEELRQMAEDRRTANPTERESQRGGESGPSRNGSGYAPQRNGFEYPHDTRSTNGHSSQAVSRSRTRPRANPGPDRGAAADALRSNQLEQLFLHQSAMIREELTKPYLGDIPQKYAAERVIFDWLEFLVLKGGFKRTMDALRYYRTIDWITADVESALQDYLVGFSDAGHGTHDLDVDDHQLSLVYVARLASMS